VNRSSKIFIALTILAAALSVAALLYQWRLFARENNLAIESILHKEKTIERVIKKKPAQKIAKGIYLTAYSAGSSKKINEIIELLNTTELNAVVIDIKDYSGLVLYDTKLKEFDKELFIWLARVDDFRIYLSLSEPALPL
jgi:hypothetical protein